MYFDRKLNTKWHSGNTDLRLVFFRKRGFYFMFIPYEDQLKDIRWIRKSNLILIRDNFKCQHIGCVVQYKGIEVHHIDYINGLMAWEYPDDMLITLCRIHHEAEFKTKRDKVETMLITTLKTHGFLVSDLLSLSCKVDTDTKFTQSLLNVLRNG